MAKRESPKRLLIIDGNALVHRAYYALPPLKTKRGELVNAVFGFCSVFLRALKELKPDFVAACFDFPAPTFRHKEFKDYKAKRPKAPEELYRQIADVKKILSAFGVPVFEKQGFEADDLIGTIALAVKRKQVFPKIEIVILSSDLDLLQLVDEQTRVYTTKKGIKDMVLYGIEEVKERYKGLAPEQLLDFRALRGDPSDNIPGVAGIGEKTAIQLLREFGTLENLYLEIEGGAERAQKIKPGVLQKLKDCKEQTFLSKKLAEIHCAAPIDFQLKDCELRGHNQVGVAEIFRDFEFETLLSRLPKPGVGPVSDVEAFLWHTPDIRLTSASLEKKIEKLYQAGVFSEKIAQTEKFLIPIVKKMEENGIRIDSKALNKFSDFLNEKIGTLQKEIYHLTGKEFNINSSQQLSEILFTQLGISQKGLKKTPGGVISTGADELKKLKVDHPIISLILEYRELFKLKTGFVESLPEMISPNDGRLHPHFHQLGTETGRMSCSEPNLQNIPVKSELGKEIRRCFVPESGFKFLSADYSQMELRLAALLSQDKKMAQFFKEGKDVHKMTACEIFKLPEKEITEKQRNLAKSLNFGILYGMGPYGLSDKAGIALKEAKEFIKKYKENFKGIVNYLDRAVEDTRKKGFSQTLFGRKRFLPEINSRDHRLKAQAERMARNFPVQGTAADIVKMAMVELQKQKIINDECRLLLQIHDELLFEVKSDKIKEVAPRIKKIMEEVAKDKAPLRVEIRQGNNWAEIK